MNEVSRITIEETVAIVGWGQIFAFGMIVAILTVLTVCVLLQRRPSAGRYERSHPKPMPVARAVPTQAVLSPAAVVGSDYYVPASDEFAGQIKETILERQKRDALLLARELVLEYRRLLESGEGREIYLPVAGTMLRDYTVRGLCEDILQSRGWCLSGMLGGKYLLGPNKFDRSCKFTPAELQQVCDSQSIASLIQSNIIAPRHALALNLAQQLVNGYRAKLESEKPTETGIVITLPEPIGYSVFAEVENILAPRGWSVYHNEGSSYRLYPAEKRDVPYRGIGFI